MQELTSRACGTSTAILRLEGLRRTFRQGSREIVVLAGASAELLPGQAVALVGPSGAGKSTLLHIAGLLETPDEGRVCVNGRDCARMDDRERTRVRRSQMGFVYQFHQLLPEFSALENVVMPQLILGRREREARQRAARCSPRWASASASITGRRSCRAASSSAPRSRARWPTARGCCSRTSRRGTWTRRRAGACSTSSSSSSGPRAWPRSSPRTTWSLPRMDRVLRLENGQLVEIAPARVA